MTDQIILLTGELEGPYLARLLWEHNPELDIAHAQTLPELLEVSHNPEAKPYTNRRLIAFITGVIVPLDILNLMNGPSYNFHPGPPDYPGTHPSCFAIYRGVQKFGATVHIMEKKVDSGKIIDVESFSVEENLKYIDLEALVYQASLRQFSRLAPQLALADEALDVSDYEWSGTRTTHRDIEDMKKIVADLSEEEIFLRYRAFG